MGRNLQLRRPALLASLLALVTAAALAAPPAGAIELDAAAPGFTSAVAVGQRYSCAIAADGAVWCWGSRDSAGQERQPPTRVDGINDAVTIAAAEDHQKVDGPVCAVTAAGTTFCFSIGGQAVQKSFSPAKTVATGGYGTCVVTQAGRVECEPGVPLFGIDDATAVTVGSTHACALTAAGDVICWGGNRYGQLGNGLAAPDDSPHPPARVQLDQRATSVSAGGHHTCATLSDGSARCWGVNTEGQLGNGVVGPAGTPNPRPLRVANLAGEQVGISASQAGTCSRSRAGAVYCWGRHGQARGLSDSRPGVPGRALGLHGIAHLATGTYHGCAVTSGGAIKCWGSDIYGATGDRSGHGTPNVVSEVTAAAAAQPPQDPGVTPVHGSPWVQIATGWDNSCGVKQDGTVWCWGSGQLAQQRPGEEAQSMLTPTRVTGLPAAKAVSVGVSNACAIDRIDRLFCWGPGAALLGLGLEHYPRAAQPQLVDGLPAVRQVSFSFGICALTLAGDLYCWGRGEWTGLGTTDVVPYPRKHDGLPRLATVDFGWRHACAASSGGSLWCWGHNDYGQLGNGSVSPQVPYLTPQRVSVPSVSDVSAGWYHTCALTQPGVPWCWGTGKVTGRPAGDPFSLRTIPGAVQGAPAIRRLTTYGWHQCAESVADELWCWGENLYQQLGNADADSGGSVAPVRSALAGVQQAAGGLAHTCAIDQQQELFCWGHNAYGQIGIGTTSSSEWISAVEG